MRSAFTLKKEKLQDFIKIKQMFKRQKKNNIYSTFQYEKKLKSIFN